MSSFKGSYSVRIFTIKIQSNNFVKAQKLVQDSPASSHLERKSIERRRVRIEWKFSKNQYTFRKVLDMRMCKIVIKLPCWCTYSLFLEMWGVSAVLLPLRVVRGEGVVFLTWIQVDIQRFTISLRNGLFEKYREYPTAAFAIWPRKTLYFLLQLSPMKTELPVGITLITWV